MSRTVTDAARPQPAQDPEPIEVVDEIIADAVTAEPGRTVQDFVKRWVAPGGGE
ncbi:MAG TPA: hypothetical protein VGQ83_39625 [Polyangia bacterium]|jgi:hypothetical protein